MDVRRRSVPGSDPRSRDDAHAARGPSLGVGRTTPATSQGPALGRLGSGPPGWDLAFTAGTDRPKEPDMTPTRTAIRALRVPVQGELDGAPDDWTARPR
jgi:hypothetical protein